MQGKSAELVSSLMNKGKIFKKEGGKRNFLAEAVVLDRKIKTISGLRKNEEACSRVIADLMETDSFQRAVQLEDKKMKRPSVLWVIYNTAVCPAFKFRALEQMMSLGGSYYKIIAKEEKEKLIKEYLLQLSRGEKSFSHRLEIIKALDNMELSYLQTIKFLACRSSYRKYFS